jgi:hypothetical protein
MTHTVDSLMALADEYTRLCTFMQEGTAAGLAKKAREALRTALTEALGFRPDWVDFENGRECGRLEVEQPVNTSQERVEKSGGNVQANGWNDGLSQDYNAKLGRWFAERLGSKHQLRKTFQQPVIGCVDHDCAECAARVTQPVRGSMTDEQIETLRGRTFSINNPFCPVDSKSMRKAVRAVERAHGIGCDK